MSYLCFVKLYLEILEYFPSCLCFHHCVIRVEDPIFSLATPLCPEEVNSYTREVIAPPDGQQECPANPGAQAEEPTTVQGGWFGRGYGKGRKKKKKAA